jgi:hypothetical protein
MLAWKSQRVIAGLVTGGVVAASAFWALALRRGDRPTRGRRTDVSNRAPAPDSPDALRPGPYQSHDPELSP